MWPPDLTVHRCQFSSPTNLLIRCFPKIGLHQSQVLAIVVQFWFHSSLQCFTLLLLVLANRSWMLFRRRIRLLAIILQLLFPEISIASFLCTVRFFIYLSLILVPAHPASFTGRWFPRPCSSAIWISYPRTCVLSKSTLNFVGYSLSFNDVSPSKFLRPMIYSGFD